MRRFRREKSVTKANLHVGMPVECGERGVQRGRNAVVVEQQAHAHAAVGGLAQFFEQQGAGEIVAPDVILDVQRTLGAAHERHARGEGVERVRKRVDAGEVGMGGEFGRDGCAKLSRSRLL
jgi:hypothetical protein